MEYPYLGDYNNTGQLYKAVVCITLFMYVKWLEMHTLNAEQSGSGDLGAHLFPPENGTASPNLEDRSYLF